MTDNEQGRQFDISETQKMSGTELEFGATIVLNSPIDRQDLSQMLKVDKVKQMSTFKGTQRASEPHEGQQLPGTLQADSVPSSWPNNGSHEQVHKQPDVSGGSVEAEQQVELSTCQPDSADGGRARWTNSNEDFHAFISVPLQATREHSTTLKDGEGNHTRKDSVSISDFSVYSTGEAQPPFRFAGILAIIFASLCYSLCILFVKMLPDYDGFGEKAQVLFVRGLVIMSLCGVNIIYSGSTFCVGEGEKLMNFLRAISATLSIFFSYVALDYISSGDSTAIIFSAPIWTSILSYFIFNEPLYWIHFVGLPASLFGIVLIAHPTLIVPVEYMWSLDSLAVANLTGSVTSVDEQSGENFDLEHRWPGIATSFLSSVTVAMTFIVFKFRKTTSIQTTTFYLAAYMAVLGAALMCFVGPGTLPTTIIHWLLLLGNGVFSWLAQTTFQWAFKYENPGVLSIIRTSELAFTFGLSAAVLGDAIYWTSIVGALIICGVVILIILDNLIASQSHLSSTSKLEPQTHAKFDAGNDVRENTLTKLKGKTNLHLFLSESPKSTISIRT